MNMIVALIVALIMAVDDILDIPKYLMQNNNIVKKRSDLLKMCLLWQCHFLVAMN